MKRLTNLMVLGLICLFVVSGCSEADNSHKSGTNKIHMTTREFSLRTGGYSLRAEDTDQELASLRTVAEPMIYPLADSVLVQFYGSSNCIPSISYNNTTMNIRLDLIAVVNYDGTETCTADLVPYTFRIFAEADNLTEQDWKTIAQNAVWINYNDYPKQERTFRQADEVRIAD